MKSVFADSSYWIALLNPRDTLHARVKSLYSSLDGCRGAARHERDVFREAFVLYSTRGDKSWSQTDCASFCVIKDHGITEALTHDRHFEQAGFVALLR